MNRYRGAFMLALALCTTASVPAVADERTITLDPVWDSVGFAAGLAASVATKAALDREPAAFVQQNPAFLWDIDEATCFSHDDTLSTLSEVTTGVTLFYPVLFALDGKKNELFPAAVVCAESMLWTYTAKNCLKYLVPRMRPYSCRSATLPPELLDEVDESFPSGPYGTCLLCGDLVRRACR